MKIPTKILSRQHEITADFQAKVSKHLEDIVTGRADVMYEIRDFAKLMFIHPTHLSNTIKLATGHSACYFFEAKIMEHAKTMLCNRNMPIGEVARILTYDPSNFTKFFKHFAQITPKQFRENHFREQFQKTATITI